MRRISLSNLNVIELMKIDYHLIVFILSDLKSLIRIITHSLFTSSIKTQKIGRLARWRHFYLKTNEVIFTIYL